MCFVADSENSGGVISKYSTPSCQGALTPHSCDHFGTRWTFVKRQKTFRGWKRCSWNYRTKPSCRRWVLKLISAGSSSLCISGVTLMRLGLIAVLTTLKTLKKPTQRCKTSASTTTFLWLSVSVCPTFPTMLLSNSHYCCSASVQNGQTTKYTSSCSCSVVFKCFLYDVEHKDEKGKCFLKKGSFLSIFSLSLWGTHFRSARAALSPESGLSRGLRWKRIDFKCLSALCWTVSFSLCICLSLLLFCRYIYTTVTWRQHHHSNIIITTPHHQRLLCIIHSSLKLLDCLPL